MNGMWLPRCSAGHDGVLRLQGRLLAELEVAAGFHGAHRISILIYGGLADETCTYPSVDEVVDKWCKQGTNICYYRSTAGMQTAKIRYGQRTVLAYLYDTIHDNHEKAVPGDWPAVLRPSPLLATSMCPFDEH
jgi:hypothetical protein